MRRMFLAAAFCAATGGAAAAAEPVCGAQVHSRFGETRAYFGDVLAACRPTGYCSAVVALPDREGGAAYAQQIRIARPSPAADYQVELTGVTPFPATPPTPMRLRFSRARYSFDAGDLFQDRSLGTNEYRIRSQSVTDEVVESLKKEAWARWTYQSKDGPAIASFGLRGSTAALEWVDCMGREILVAQE